MTTIFDPKAARQIAAGERAKADAAAQQQQLFNQRLAMENELLYQRNAAERERQAREQARLDAEQAAQRADQHKTDRKAARAQRWEKARRQVPDLGISALWATVIVAPLVLTFGAQTEFAEKVLHLEPALLFPVAVEAGAWVCAFEAHRRARRGEPVGALTRWMWLLAGLAALINTVHGIRTIGWLVGPVLGVVSVLGVLLHHIRQSADAALAEGVSTGEVRRRAARRVLHPVLSLRAAGITARTGAAPAEAFRLAFLDAHGCPPETSRPRRRVVRKQLRHELRQALKTAGKGELPTPNSPLRAMVFNQSETGINLLGLPAMALPENPAETVAPEASGEWPEADRELLATVQKMIATEELDVQPTGWAIYRRVMNGKGDKARAYRVAEALRAEPAATPPGEALVCGTDTAREVRDALKSGGAEWA